MKETVCTSRSTTLRSLKSSWRPETWLRITSECNSLKSSRRPREANNLTSKIGKARKLVLLLMELPLFQQTPIKRRKKKSSLQRQRKRKKRRLMPK